MRVVGVIGNIENMVEQYFLEKDRIKEEPKDALNFLNEPLSDSG